MNKHIFKSIQKSMIDSSFMDFYFPDNLNHPFVTEMKAFQEKSSDFRFQILMAKDEEDLQKVASILDKQLKLFDKLSKEDFPGLNYFFSTLEKDEFNFDFLKTSREANFNKLSFLQKFKLNVSVSIPEQYVPSQNVKDSIFKDFGFQYLYVPTRKLTASQSAEGFYNFINQTNLLMTQMDKPKKSISLNGELGVYLETSCALYGHKPKCIGFTTNIVASTLLHEWTHAIDNFIFQKLSGINDYASENVETFSVKNKNFLPAYEAIKSVLFKVCNEDKEKPDNNHQVIGKKKSIYYYNCLVADEDLFVTPDNYYQKPCEILARMTESGEFPNYTDTRNKDLTNLVYLKTEQNPYKELKEIFFSVTEKPTLKITQIRELTIQNSALGNSIPKDSISKFKL